MNVTHLGMEICILAQKGGVFDVFSPHLSRPLWGKTLTSPGCWKCLETRPWVGVIHHILGISSTKIRMVHHSSCLIFGCFQKSKMDICAATPTGLRPLKNEEFRKAGDGSAPTKPATNCSIWRLYRRCLGSYLSMWQLPLSPDLVIC